MARQNYVILHGQVMENPSVFIDQSSGEPTRAVFYMTIIERSNYNPDGSKNTQRYDCPIIISLNKKLIQKISELKKWDMVDITGVLCTIRTLKRNYCTCGALNEYEGQAVYINPIYVCKRESENMSARKGHELLKERAEVSNNTFLIGNLCNDPAYFEEPGYITNCSYALAVNRKIRIAEDPDSMTTDYPWIKTFGAMAQEDYENLQKGSRVYIHGMLRTRTPKRTFVCDTCGCEYEAAENVVDIVPYAVEYLSNLKKAENEEDEYNGEEEPAFESEIES